VGKQVSKPASQ